MLKNYDVVGIDEGQFFPDIVEFCEEAANQGKTVMVAALDGTFERKAFGNIISLIPMAEKVTKLCAVCVYCTKEAAFTKRVIESRQIQLIGGAEMYKPVCRLCFFLEQEP
jgi:thymidine kinase